MIKRRYFRQDHGDESGSSSDSSSDLDSCSDASGQEEELDESEQSKPINGVGEEEEEEEEEESEGEEEDDVQPSMSLPGYVSEDSSEIEAEEDSLALVATMEEEKMIEKPGKIEKKQSSKIGTLEENGEKPELDSCILKWKSVFKCKFCPKIVCLSEKIMKQHLESKRHKRSKKLFEEGRLKVMLNSDGELEEDYETHAERYARTMALAQEEPHVAKKDSGRQRQSRRRQKKRSRKGAEKKAEQQIVISDKKKQKTED